MSFTHSIIIIAIIATITFLTRATPFIFFGRENSKIPEPIIYLGKVLPPAVMSMLIIYCLNNISLIKYPYGIPEISCVILAIMLHLYKRNNFISIFVSTIVYMIMVQYIFI